jgi:hypothetical protein
VTEWQKPSVIVAAAARDVEAMLNEATRLSLAAGLDSGRAKWFGELALGIRLRLARAVDDVRVAEVPARWEFPGVTRE